MSKGVELPINVLVIVAVAVIVLLGIIALFMAMFGPTGPTFEIESAWNKGCSKITANCFAYQDAGDLDFASGIRVPLDNYVDEDGDEAYPDYESKFLGLCLFRGYCGAWDDSTESTYTKEDAVKDCVTACGCNIFG